jgi:hypothetical protein
MSLVLVGFRFSRWWAYGLLLNGIIALMAWRALSA